MKEKGNEKPYSIINVAKVNIHEHITFPNRDNQCKTIYGRYTRRDKPFRLVPLTTSRVNAQESHFAAQLVSRELKVTPHKKVTCPVTCPARGHSYVYLLILFLQKVPTTFPCGYVLILTLGHVSAMGLFIHRSSHSRLQNAVSGLSDREVTRMNLKIRTHSIRHVITIEQQITQGNCFDAWPSSHKSMK